MKWTEKKADILESGYVLDVCWGCELDEKLDNAKNIHSKIFPGIFKRTQKESDLIQGIDDGSLFGFVFCDLDSSVATIQKWKSFPLIFKRLTVTYDHLSPAMKQQLELEKPEEKKFERETLVQGFHSKDQVIFTPLLRFYISQGVKISNITGFVQFIPRKCLNPFADHD